MFYNSVSLSVVSLHLLGRKIDKLAAATHTAAARWLLELSFRTSGNRVRMEVTVEGKRRRDVRLATKDRGSSRRGGIAWEVGQCAPVSLLVTKTVLWNGKNSANLKNEIEEFLVCQYYALNRKMPVAA